MELDSWHLQSQKANRDQYQDAGEKRVDCPPYIVGSNEIQSCKNKNSEVQVSNASIRDEILSSVGQHKFKSMRSTVQG